jgi:hypothetical protein
MKFTGHRERFSLLIPGCRLSIAGDDKRVKTQMAKMAFPTLLLLYAFCALPFDLLLDAMARFEWCEIILTGEDRS